MSRVQVTPTPGQYVPALKKHWLNAAGTLFKNPWPSFRQKGAIDTAKMVWEVQFQSGIEKVDIDAVIPQVKPVFSGYKSSQIKATWLGHACYLVEMPSIEDRKGVTILFDPVFSQRCSPFSFMGPLRFTKPPCRVEDLPEIDLIVISHNHYDHTDLPTLSSLYQQQKATPPHLFLPLNTSRSLTGLGIPSEGISELDWWEARDVKVQDKGSVRVTCTPCQHFTGRGVTDRNESLWASWAVEGIDEGRKGAKVWFGGDTGYCTVDSNDSHSIEPDLPICPAFKEIGERFGGFDLGLIPIGAYAPRNFMSPIHNAPIDSVRMFKDIKCRRALGIHWGAWRLTSEAIDEPPKKLAIAREEVGLAEDAFETCAIGETRTYDVV